MFPPEVVGNVIAILPDELLNRYPLMLVSNIHLAFAGTALSEVPMVVITSLFETLVQPILLSSIERTL